MLERLNSVPSVYRRLVEMEILHDLPPAAMWSSSLPARFSGLERAADLAESALFAYALLHHPNRIPKEEAARIARIIPNRIAFVEKLLPKDKPLHFAIEAKR